MLATIAIASVSLLLCFSTAYGTEKDLRGKLKPGDKAPGFALRDLDGQMRYLSDYCGTKKEKYGEQPDRRPVILSFIATWCKPCKRELPKLQEFYIAHKDDKVELFLIFCERSLKVEQAKKFLKKYDVTMPALFDRYLIVNNKYGVDILPATFMITPEGTIQSIHIAAENIDEILEENLDKAVPVSAGMVEATSSNTLE